MIEVVTRLVVEWQTDPANGLNAQLLTVPRAAAIPLPAPVEIFNALDHDFVARGHIPQDRLKDGPIITIAAAVSDQQPVLAALLPSRQQTQSAEVPIQITAVLKSSASAEQRTAAGLMLRAAFRALAKKFDSNTTTFTRDQCVVRLGDSPPALFTQLVASGDELLTGALIVPFTVLDRWALGIT